MSLVAGALCLDGSWSPELVAERIARRAERYENLVASKLHADARFALFAINRRSPGADIPCRKRGAALSWVFGDLNYFHDPIAIEDGDWDDPLRRLDRKLPGRWLVLQYETDGAVRASTDRLGLQWLYVGRIPGGVVFSSDFGALVEEMRGRISINEDALLWELCIGYSPGNETIFNEIALAPGGTTVELLADGCAALNSVEPQYGDRHAGLSRQDKFRRLDEIYADAFGEIVKMGGPSLTLSISAGNDSRYALALLDKIGVAPQLFTFGHPDSDEARNAAEICRRIGRSNALFQIPASDWEAWNRVMRQLGNAGMLQWTGWPERWLEFLRSKGTNVIIGYLGDALTGGHFRRIDRGITDWQRFWLDWSAAGGWLESPLLRPAARARAVAAMERHAALDLAGVDPAFAFQRALHLDLYGRQRRWTGDQPNLMSRAVLPILPFYRDRIIDFWMNLPLSDLLDQELYLEYARSRFPRLFPRPPVRVAELAGRALRKAKRIALRVAGAQPDAAPRPVVIDRSLAIMQNRQHVADLAMHVKPQVDHMIDIERLVEQVRRFDGSNQQIAGHIIRATNVFLLLSLNA